MPVNSVIRLVLLAAIWGGSFLFIRIAASQLAPAWMMELRVGLAAVFLTLCAWQLKRALQWQQHWKHYLILGLFNSALPFLLFAYAAQTLTASLLSVLNALSPLFGVVIAALYHRQALSLTRTAGLIAGVAGVGVLAGFDPVMLAEDAGFALLCALSAACSYGIASTYAQESKGVSAFSNAYGSMWGASLWLLPLALFAPLPEVVTVSLSLTVLMLGVLCTGVAYLLYFRLIADVGGASALTVTFLIPLFGILWGVIFLDEPLGWHMLAGAALVLTGTAWVTGFSVKQLRHKEQAI